MTNASGQPLSHSLSFLATADSVELGADVERAAAALREGVDAEPGVLWPALTNVVRQCLGATSDADSLSPMSVRQLVFAATFVARKRLDRAEQDEGQPGFDAPLLAQLRRLGARKADFSAPVTKAIADLIDRLALTSEEPEPAPTATVETTHVHSATSHTPAPRLNPVDEWVRDRGGIGVDARAGRDVALLEAHAATRIPTAFAEALYEDDAVWGAAAMADWVRKLDAPIDATIAGTASAGLLNARLRESAPRLFLRHPNSLVIQPIASRAEVGSLRDEVGRELVSHALRNVWDVIFILQTERERKSGARVVELDKAVKALDGAFRRAGYEKHPQEGAEVRFDPTVHTAIDEATENQELVVVKRPGLCHRDTGEVVIRPVVDRMRAIESEKRGQS